ncbi:MAG: hypothetical protein J0I41_11995 [Filimonas sp.]|nr:hypothetical protein [Filimonas sp.]
MKHLLLIFIAVCVVHTMSFAYDSIPAKTDSLPAVMTVTAGGVTTKLSLIDTVAVTDRNCAGVKKSEFGCITAFVIIFLVIISFIWLTLKSNLLRDTVNNPQLLLENAQKLNPTKYATYTADDAVNKIPRSFSLSRAQLGIWIVIITCAYAYLALCKYWGISIVFNNTALALLGISAATAAAGNVIDKAQESNECRHQNTPSQGFLYDILSDQNGVSIHRFQNVVWTLIAAIIYICKINNTACGFLPDLDNTLIALSGISNATYLGIKINENSKVSQ